MVFNPARCPGAVANGIGPVIAPFGAPHSAGPGLAILPVEHGFRGLRNAKDSYIVTLYG